MYRGVVGELLWEVVPLAAATHPEDDRIEGFALVDAGPPGALGRVAFGEDRHEGLPQLVGHSPDGGKRLLLG